jgi:NADH-quinone oxidoreductase subunit G
MVVKAREGVMEFLLANHPLDCPICDQGGECDLQDQAVFYGKGEGVYSENKRAVKDKNFGPFVKTEMTRCIHCMRCVRFATEVAGIEELGSVGRGENMEVATYVDKVLESELSGNMIDLCPVGALTSKPNAYAARSWELVKTQSIDVHDAVGSAIRVDSRGMSVMRIVPSLNEDINEEWISDKTRFSYDGLKLQRIDRPYVRDGDGKLVEASWADALDYIADRSLSVHAEGKEFAALAGDLADVESMFMMKKLMGKLESNNYDCRPENSVMKAKYRSDYIFNSSIAAIEESDLCLIIGANPRIEASLVNARINKKLKADNNYRVSLLGEGVDLAYDYDHLGNDLSLLEEISKGKHDICKKLSSAKKPLIIVGEACFVRDDSGTVMALVKEIVEKYKVVSEKFNGFNILHNSAARVGGLDLGFLPGSKGKDNAGIVRAVSSGKIGMVFLLGYDADNVEKLKNSCNIYIGSHGDKGAEHADVILPAAAYTEKDAIYVNMEGRIQNTRRATSLVGQACEDWEIVNRILERLEFENYKDKYELLADLKEQHGVFVNAQNEIFRDNNISEYKKLKLGKDKELKSFVDNFYITNVINKASRNMLEATREFAKK